MGNFCKKQTTYLYIIWIKHVLFYFAIKNPDKICVCALRVSDTNKISLHETDLLNIHTNRYLSIYIFYRITHYPVADFQHFLRGGSWKTTSNIIEHYIGPWGVQTPWNPLVNPPLIVPVFTRGGNMWDLVLFFDTCCYIPAIPSRVNLI